MGFWVLSRHAEMQAIGSDAETFSSARAPDAPGGGTLIEDLPYGFAAGVLLNMMDDPRHHRIRRLVTPAVAPRALALLEAELRARTAAILDAVAARGRCDFLVDVAVELPLQAIAMLMGVPDEDRHDLDGVDQRHAHLRRPRARHPQRRRRSRPPPPWPPTAPP